MELNLGGWGEFVLAIAVFLASHTIPARPAVRRTVVGALGEKLYLWVYSLVSVGVLAWLVVAAGRAPFVALWPFELWQLWVPNLTMPLVCLLLAFGVFAVNPFSFFGVAPDRFDPEYPGIAGVTRHPVLWATALWASAHMVPNANLAHLILFGMFAGFSFLGMVMIDRRQRRQQGETVWRERAARTSLWPFEAFFSGRWRPRPARIGLVRLATAGVLWAGLIFGHEWAIGVVPWPQF